MSCGSPLVALISRGKSLINSRSILWWNPIECNIRVHDTFELSFEVIGNLHSSHMVHSQRSNWAKVPQFWPIVYEWQSTPMVQHTWLYYLGCMRKFDSLWHQSKLGGVSWRFGYLKQCSEGKIQWTAIYGNNPYRGEDNTHGYIIGVWKIYWTHGISEWLGMSVNNGWMLHWYWV